VTLRRPDAALVHWLRLTRAPILPADRAWVGRPAVHPAIARARADLRRFGIPTRLAFVWSGDGSGVVEDEPRTIHIHRRMIAADRAPAAVLAASERTAALDLLSVVRHELGHALFFLEPRAGATGEFRRLFGDVRRRYRVGMAADEVERRLRRHGGLANPRYRRAISLYAVTHPHEAFAEAVRIALAVGGEAAGIDAWVARHDLAPRVGEQIRYAAGWLRGYRRR
jgi:hypothetical protein